MNASVNAFYFLVCLFKHEDCITLQEKCHNIDDIEFNLDMTYKTWNFRVFWLHMYICHFCSYVFSYFYLSLRSSTSSVIYNPERIAPLFPQTQKSTYIANSVQLSSSAIKSSFSIKHKDSAWNFISTIQKALLKVHRQKQDLYISSPYLLFSHPVPYMLQTLLRDYKNVFNCLRYYLVYPV